MLSYYLVSPKPQRKPPEIKDNKLNPLQMSKVNIYIKQLSNEQKLKILSFGTINLRALQLVPCPSLYRHSKEKKK